MAVSFSSHSSSAALGAAPLGPWPPVRPSARRPAVCGTAGGAAPSAPRRSRHSASAGLPGSTLHFFAPAHGEAAAERPHQERRAVSGARRRCLGAPEPCNFAEDGWWGCQPGGATCQPRGSPPPHVLGVHHECGCSRAQRLSRFLLRRTLTGRGACASAVRIYEGGAAACPVPRRTRGGAVGEVVAHALRPHLAAELRQRIQGPARVPDRLLRRGRRPPSSGPADLLCRGTHSSGAAFATSSAEAGTIGWVHSRRLCRQAPHHAGPIALNEVSKSFSLLLS